MSSNHSKSQQLVLSAFFLAAALLLPFLTMHIPTIGAMLCPMHIPVLLCGFFCGPFYGLLTGALAPLFRFLIFGMPPIYPSGIGMCFELAAYGYIAGLLYARLPKKPIWTYVSLLTAMVCGRIVWGIVRVILYGVSSTPFGWSAFIAGAFTTAVPGIILQIVLIPPLVIVLRKN